MSLLLRILPVIREIYIRMRAGRAANCESTFLYVIEIFTSPLFHQLEMALLAYAVSEFTIAVLFNVGIGSNTVLITCLPIQTHVVCQLL